MDEVIGGPAKAAGVVRLGDQPGSLVSAAVEVEPPKRGAADERYDECRNRRRAVGVRKRQWAEQSRERGADDDDGLAERDQDEGLASLGEVAALDVPLLRRRSAEARRIEADQAADDVGPSSQQPEQRLAGTESLSGRRPTASAPLTQHQAEDPLVITG